MMTKKKLSQCTDFASRTARPTLKGATRKLAVSLTSWTTLRALWKEKVTLPQRDHCPDT